MAVVFLSMLAASGVHSTPGVLILPLFGPFAAATMERIGLRTVLAGALLLLSVAMGRPRL